MELVCKMSRRVFVTFISAVLLLLFGCQAQDAVLSYAPTEEPVVSTPNLYTPVPSATPFFCSVDPFYGSEFPNDNSGVAVIDPDSHFFKIYISFSDIRIYEEDERCFFDAVCTNGYEEVLTGKCNIVFFDKEGRSCGSGRIHTADDASALILPPGESRVFAEIFSEDAVAGMDFEIRPVSPFLPQN